MLRKREYENIIRVYFGVVPQVEPVFHFSAFLEKFEEIPIIEAQKLAFQEMKKKKQNYGGTISRDPTRTEGSGLFFWTYK